MHMAQKQGKEEEGLITFLPAISGLIRCVGGPFQAVIDETEG